MNSITRLTYLSSRKFLLKEITVRRQSFFPTNREQLKAKWNNLIERTDAFKCHGVEGIWGHYARHYTWHGNGIFAIHVQCCTALFLIVFYSTYGFKKVDIVADRSWKGGSRNFLWRAIEDRYDYEYEFAWEPFEQPKPPKLLLMRTLQKEMWAAALKRGTWFLAS